MRGTSVGILGVCAALLVAMPLYAGDRVSEPISRTFTLDGTGRLSVANVNGSVRVTTWDRSEVKVEGTRWADTRDHLEDIEVRMDADGDHVDIEVKYRKHGWHHDGEMAVDLVITVPRTIRIEEATLVNGKMSIEDVAGDVHASTVNGGLTVSGLSGDADLATVNGSLTASFERVADKASIKLNTVNGSVEVTLPKTAGVRLHASTVNGAIESDAGFTVSKMDMVGRSMTGTIGDGSASLDVDTVNGSIRIRGAGV